MRKRMFRMTGQPAALEFCARLMKFGHSFEVKCSTSGIDVVTSFELKLDEFPEAGWLA